MGDDCTFTTLASPGDSLFLNAILRHLLKMCAFPFREILLVADDLPKKNRDARALDAFLSQLESLRAEGLISRWVSLNAMERDRKQLSLKYFGSSRAPARDHRGIPLFGWIAGLEAAATDFVVHFDSDNLLYQKPGQNWIESAMELMAKDPVVMFAAPLPGPPASSGELKGQVTLPNRDQAGNFRFKTFSSRRFLVSKERLRNMLPTPLVFSSPKRAALMRFGFGNAILPWESCIGDKLSHSNFYRVNLCNPNAWVLHCAEHSTRWLSALPTIIERVEEGYSPAEQAGYYDLMLQAWEEEAV